MADDGTVTGLKEEITLLAGEVSDASVMNGIALSDFFDKQIDEFLEKIVLHNSHFDRTRNRQNLLIISAIKANKQRVMDYIHRLDVYDGPEIAEIALRDPYLLYEEAVRIYTKCGQNSEAMEVLLMNLDFVEPSSKSSRRAATRTPLRSRRSPGT